MRSLGPGVVTQGAQEAYGKAWHRFCRALFFSPTRSHLCHLSCESLFMYNTINIVSAQIANDHLQLSQESSSSIFFVSYLPPLLSHEATTLCHAKNQPQHSYTQYRPVQTVKSRRTLGFVVFDSITMTFFLTPLHDGCSLVGVYILPGYTLLSGNDCFRFV